MFKKLAAVVLGVTLASGTALAAEYPDKPIRIIVPFSTGGGNDLVARIMAKTLDPLLKTTIVVENRPGAGGNVGLAAASRAAPDGYTIAHIQSGVAINPYLYRDVGFDMQKDFTPVGMLATTPTWVLVNPDLKVNTIGELIDYARANPGKLTYATPGVGTPHHLGAELLKSMARIDMLHVPYKGASGAATDVVGGQVPVLISTPASIQGFVDAGQLRLLASMEPQRSADHPDLPTISETVPGFSTTIWHGFAVPAGTDPQVVGKLSSTLEQVLRQPALQQELQNVGFTAKYETSEALKDRIAAELKMWGEVTRQAGISPE